MFAKSFMFALGKKQGDGKAGWECCHRPGRGNGSLCEVTKGQIPEAHGLAHTFWNIEGARDI